MRKILLLLLLLILCVFTACSNVQDVEIPLSEDKPTLLVFCDNDVVSCFDISDVVSPRLTTEYGEDAIVYGYYFVDSPLGADIFNQLELAEIPSYVIFDASQIEVFRHEGEIELEQLETVFSELLPD